MSSIAVFSWLLYNCTWRFEAEIWYIPSRYVRETVNVISTSRNNHSQSYNTIKVFKISFIFTSMAVTSYKLLNRLL